MRNSFDTVQEQKKEGFQTADARKRSIATQVAEALARQATSEKQNSSKGRTSPTAARPRLREREIRPERRQLRRASVKLPVRLRPANWKDQSFEEVLATLNA